MAKAKPNSNLLMFALAGFLLLAVLFGMQIMTFIFGNIGSDTLLPQDGTFTVRNETPAFINDSGYQLLRGLTERSFRNLALISVMNNTDNSSSVLTLFDITALGIVTNNTPELYPNVSISYTYTAKTAIQNQIDSVNNKSLGAINNYATQSGVQFTTLGVAITLVILVLVFAFFWKSFMGTKGDDASIGGTFG